MACPWLVTMSSTGLSGLQAAGNCNGLCHAEPMIRILTVVIAALIAFGSLAGSTVALGSDLEANSEKVAR